MSHLSTYKQAFCIRQYGAFTRRARLQRFGRLGNFRVAACRFVPANQRSGRADTDS
jgi:hypothetical protein